MTSRYLAKAAELAPLIEKVHGANHPELTRVRELTEQLTSPGADAPALFAELRSVTDDYALPGDACEAFEATYLALSRAEADQFHQAVESPVGHPSAL